MILAPHLPPFTGKFRSLTGLSKDTVLGQTDSGDFYFGILDQNQKLVMFDKVEAMEHGAHEPTT
jgi:hypothetical protein